MLNDSVMDVLSYYCYVMFITLLCLCYVSSFVLSSLLAGGWEGEGGPPSRANLARRIGSRAGAIGSRSEVNKKHAHSHTHTHPSAAARSQRGALARLGRDRLG